MGLDMNKGHLREALMLPNKHHVKWEGEHAPLHKLFGKKMSHIRLNIFTKKLVVYVGCPMWSKRQLTN
ncbi:unnamed protein product [Sphenostylis stenocarpa]|uniref:Uncharacterized protein n=1 Tax=Sphenostylis stenocarpa TaxID=92480 RepID=A0AA86VNA9_9FABA|nr:unnamed protein product [Sphenostylis stenocarpa]